MQDWPLVRTLINLIDDERIHATLASMAAGLLVTQYPDEFGRYADWLFAFFMGLAGVISTSIVLGLSPREIVLEVVNEFGDDVAKGITGSYNRGADLLEDVIEDTTGVRYHFNLTEEELAELEPVLEDFIKRAGYKLVGTDYDKTVLPPGDIAG